MALVQALPSDSFVVAAVAPVFDAAADVDGLGAGGGGGGMVLKKNNKFDEFTVLSINHCKEIIVSLIICLHTWLLVSKSDVFSATFVFLV